MARKEKFNLQIPVCKETLSIWTKWKKSNPHVTLEGLLLKLLLLVEVDKET